MAIIIRRIKSAFPRQLITTVGTLSLCTMADAQKGVRVGISISSPIRPIDDSSKSLVSAILILILVVVGIAFAFWVLFHTLCAGEKVWNRLCRHSQEQQEKQKQIEREQDQVEQRQEQLRYRQRWEEMTEKAYRETVKVEARRPAEKEGAVAPSADDNLSPFAK